MARDPLDPCGQTRDPLAPRVKDVSRVLPGPNEHSGVELWHGVELDRERRHHPEVPAAAAQRPEEVRLVLLVGAHELSIGGDDFGPDHAVARQAMLTRKPAVSASQRIAHDADLGRGA
jgi:hypothetical protein